MDGKSYKITNVTEVEECIYRSLDNFAREMKDVHFTRFLSTYKVDEKLMILVGKLVENDYSKLHDVLAVRNGLVLEATVSTDWNIRYKPGTHFVEVKVHLLVTYQSLNWEFDYFDHYRVDIVTED